MSSRYKQHWRRASEDLCVRCGRVWLQPDPCPCAYEYDGYTPHPHWEVDAWLNGAELNELSPQDPARDGLEDQATYWDEFDHTHGIILPKIKGDSFDDLVDWCLACTEYRASMLAKLAEGK